MLAILLAAALAGAAGVQGATPATTRVMSPPQQPAALKRPFRQEIDAYLASDRTAAPPSCSNLFIGSSTIRRWNSLAADMRPLPVINRGFGGSQIDDVNFYFDDVVAQYHPRAIVFYSGDNDIHAGKTPDQVFADFRTFLKLKDEKLGATPVYVISAKPSRSRVNELSKQAALNGKLKALARTRHDLVYLDVAPTMLGPDGRPKDIFFSDGLHMRSVGYSYWIPIVKAALMRPPPSHAPGCA